MNWRYCWVLVLAAGLAGCRTTGKPEASVDGPIERLSPELDDLIAPGTSLELIADGFTWTEGPVWLLDQQCLLFNDIPANTTYRWKQDKGVSAFLRPSGYTGAAARGGETGANGLTIDSNGRLILCQHGDRRVAKLERSGIITPLADRFDGRRFNSPNDLVFRSNGEIYFTDPPYGLEGKASDPAREIPFCGVYRIRRDGTVDAIIKDLSFPNGIAFSPDEKRLYVAVSDPANPVIMAYDVKADGTVGAGSVLFDARALAAKGLKGLPDGLKVDEKGNLFATGPGGVLILSPAGRHLGTILTGEPTANCAWGDDGSTLYITANHGIRRIRTLTKGTIPGGR